LSAIWLYIEAVCHEAILRHGEAMTPIQKSPYGLHVLWESASRHARGTRRATRGHRALFEFLECRTLLSASISLSGNGTTIISGDTTPNLSDYTSFGPMTITPSALLGNLTRQYSIANHGDAALVLNGLVHLRGVNPLDFKIMSSPPAMIDAGSSASFTIAFSPRAVGLRTALVSITSNDPAIPMFTFEIQGTGVRTLVAADGLQVATLSPGTGIGAVVGSDLIVDYTGYRFNGFAFDSSLQPGRSPFEISPLGKANVLAGWNQGLLGAKKNEKRVLFIPSSLAHGNDTSSGLANLPLIYTLSVNAVNQPQLEISGKGLTIAPRDASPSSTDGTFLGTALGSPIASTFGIANVGAGQLQARVAPVLILSGRDASNFSLTSIGTDATFTVAFHPSVPGRYSAELHVRTNDPVHPDYTFTVAASDLPFVDLTVAQGVVKNLPAAIVSGSAHKFILPAMVTNRGNIAVPSSAASLGYELFLHDTSGESSDIKLPITPSLNPAIRGTKAGHAKMVNLPFTVPISVATGSYKLLVKINPTGAIAESDTSNNSFTGSQVLHVTQGFYNLNGTIATSTVPASIANATAIGGQLGVTVASTGNLPLAAGQKVLVQILAHNTVDNSDTTLGASTFALSNWIPGRNGSLFVPLKLDGGLPAGNYLLEAHLTPTPVVAESSADDNLITLTVAGEPVPLTVT
jgi:hypothetical protein